jgi:hypothetical protein
MGLSHEGKTSVSVLAILGLSALISLVASIVTANLWVWPRLQRMRRSDALSALVAPHMFFRTIGLSFLVPGVVSVDLPRTFAAPAAYGDLVAGLLAIAATLALAKRVQWASGLVWIFNVWGAADLLNAIYQGNVQAKIDPSMLGAAFYIPTAVVPPLLVTHGLIFWILVRRKKSAE